MNDLKQRMDSEAELFGPSNDPLGSTLSRVRRREHRRRVAAGVLGLTVAAEAMIRKSRSVMSMSRPASLTRSPSNVTRKTPPRGEA